MISFKATSDTSEEPIDFTASHQKVTDLLDANKVTWKDAAEDMGFLGVISQMGRNEDYSVTNL